MKHAGPAALDALEPLLARLRTLPGLKEKSRGIFYLKSKAFLHFHEDPAGLFADLREDGDFQRYEVTSAEGQEALFDATLRRLS
ncbi:MAG TPA: hypothetical protein PLV04_09370 [Phenylobacterium sp.]|uniref:hypothetical protein n=1 Tax=Phenylobacterium sp. TaxID=1871053 RepID=UPI002CF9C87D|nr:hypothetical protein [Phenylobacterium sp.]HQN52680.1 hypothetical protein [Phenylobacterium sp.]